MGGMGANGSLASNVLAKKADLVIAIGTRLTDFSTSSKWAFENPEVEFLSINVSGFDAMKMESQMLVADAKIALDKLTEELKNKSYQSDYDLNRLKDLKDEWTKEVDHYYSQTLESGLSQTRVIGEINRFIGEKDIITCAAGSMPGDLLRLWRTTEPKTYNMEYGFSCMGYEVAGALGAKMAADDDQEVYAFVGDGSYLMLHSELVTSIQEKKKITVLLLDNNGFQCIHGLQVGQGSEGFGNEFRYRSEEDNRLSGPYLDIDFAANARSMGAKGYTAHTIDELKKALEMAKQETVTTLIDIKVLPGTGSSTYESWWHLGVAEVSESPKVEQAHTVMEAHKSKARKY